MKIEARIKARFTAKGDNCLIGSIPVPKDWTPTSLVVEDSRGMKWPTQYSIVSRGSRDEARHLDLRAVVSSPGGEQTYKIISGIGEVIPMKPGANMPGLRISSHDHNGKLYSATMSVEPHNGTKVFCETHKAGELLGPDRFFGYSAYFTTIAGFSEVVLVRMKVQNGNVQDEILHDLFFKSIQIDLPPGWEVMHMESNPFVNGKTLMVPNANGKMHVLKQGAEKEYTFAIYKPTSAQAARNLLDFTGFYVPEHSFELWSWRNPKTANWLPEGVPVPSLNIIHDAYGANGQTIVNAIANGSALPSAEMYGAKGPFYPRGTTYGGVTGGVGITAFPALETLSSGRLSELKALFAVHSMDADRSAGVTFVDSRQTPINPMDWKDKIGGIQYIQCGQLINGHEGPWPRSKADQWRYQQVASMGLLPDYYGGLSAYQPYDFAHLIRGLGPAMALAWLINDPLAKERIATYACWSRLLMLEFGAGALASALSAAQQHPGKGGLGSREYGWAELAINADFQLTNDQKRATIKPWFEVSLQMRQLSQMENGSWQASNGKPAQIINDLIGGAAPPVRAGQSIEFGISLNGLRSTQVSTEDSRIPAMFLKAAAGCKKFQWKMNPDGSATDAPHATYGVRFEDITKPAFALKSDAPVNAFTPNTDNYQTYVVPLYALMQDENNQDALTITNWLAGKDPIAKLTGQMPFKMNEGAGPLLAKLQAMGNVPPVIVEPPPIDPPPIEPPPTRGEDPLDVLEAYIRRLNLITDPVIKKAAIDRIRTILSRLS